MKKPTKFRPRRQPRSHRCQRKGRSSLREVFSLREQLRQVLISEIRGAVADTARQLVEDEVRSLVGEPWSRKGDSPLRRNGATTSSIYLDGQPCLLSRGRVRDRDRGTEVPLQTVLALGSRNALDADVKRLLVRGVSTRNYDEALGRLAEGLGLTVGGQDRPALGRRGDRRCLRSRFQRLLLRVSTGPEPAQRAGRGRGRDQTEEDRLDTRRGHPWISNSAADLD